MKLGFVFFLGIISILQPGLATAVPMAFQENRDGYISNVKDEKYQRFYEVFLFVSPAIKERPLQDIIFNEKLSKEFQDRYREKFGQLDTESIVYQPTKFSVLDENRGAVLNIVTANDNRKKFGEYMLRRLTEWHVDNYFKTDPTMRPIYEMKEKLSHLEVKVTKETTVNAQYNFSDNSLDVIADSPYFDSSKLTLIMNPSAIGPSNVDDEKISLSQLINKKIRINTTATNVDGIGTIEFVRALKANWSTYYLTTAAYKSGGPSSRETRYLVGFSHVY